MTPTLLRRAVITCLACGAIALIGRSEPRASYLDPNLSYASRIIRMMHDRNLNKNATDAEIAGYYEGLLAGRPVQMLERARQSEEWRFRGDFLYYEAKPHLDIADYNDMPELRHITNSHGMPDIEYVMEPPPRTKRIALLGDSVTRGKGTPFGATFEALLENYLNEHHTGHGIDRFEILNFSDNGYRLTQLVDVALEKVPAFQPDVYLLCLSQLAVNRKWGDHLGQLVWDRIDLKYPFLRELAKTAELDPRDPPATMDAKLATQRLPAIRWAFSTVQEHARTQGASLVAVLVPAATSLDAQRAVFAGPHQVVDELGIPVIDLLPALANAGEPASFRIQDGDVHPNREGHRLIFELMKQQILTDEGLRRLILTPSDHGQVAGQTP